MGLKNIVKLMLIGIAALVTATVSISDVHAKTIICGKSLCTVGEKPNWDRKCLEIKDTKKDRCEYKCMGYKEPRPSDCSKDRYECVSYATSRNECAQENGGRAVDPQNKPNKYKNYTEAGYTRYEKNHMPNCSEGEAGETTCKCGREICQKGMICRKSKMLQMSQESQQMVDNYCENPAGATNSNFTTTNSVTATNGDEVQQQIDANTVDQNSGDDGCKTIEQYLTRYTSGCWSCLVVGKLTEAFMNAASAGIDVTKEAGHILLIWGFVLWLAFWALKNVSSFTEIKGGNILNDLLRTGAKVVLAWFCINAGIPAIQNFVIQPIMGVGSEIAQSFWKVNTNTKANRSGKAISDYIEDFNWEDTFEPDDPDMADEIAATVAESNGGGTSDEDPDGDGVVEEPQEVERDNIEETVIDLQNAFMKVLRQQYNEIKGSCRTMSCDTCRYMSCSDPGHRNYIANGIMKPAGYGASVNHYCQAAITAAMNKLHDIVGGKVTEVLKKARASCGSGISLGAYGNVELCRNGRQVYNKINVADTVYYNVVTTSSGVRKNVGGGSGHHAVTYSGRGQTISFNGDSIGSMCNTYYWNVTGKVLCLSCLLRAELKKGLNGLNKKKLEEFVGDATVSYINYEGGKFVDVGSGSGEMENIVQIGDVKYHGKTDIMPKSVINSMLGATKVITDNTAQMMVLGNMAMCYSNMEGGGAWTILKFKETNVTLTNIFMWLDGAILWLLGFVLTCIVAYYLIDISFKIGLAVMALPLMIGLWPFKVTQGKLAETIAIIAKAAATFAFLAITTYYAIELLAACLGGDDGLQGIYDEYDSIVNHEVSGDARDQIKEKLEDYFHIFSVGFLLMLFGCIYGYKLIRKTTEDLAEKFYSDSTFGGQNPMHKGMTGAASMVHKLDQKWGTGLAKDMAAKKVGEGVKSIAGRGALAAKSAQKSIGGGTRALVNTVRGKGDN